MTKEKIENATLEAIYWWNRDENYYHNYFSKLDKIYQNKPALDFFINKIFEMFLREYAVRRNLSEGSKALSLFIDDLFKFNFFEQVNNCKIGVIDDVSEIIKETNVKIVNNRNEATKDSEVSTIRNTKSLLSKVAFLINPHKFYLYDSLTKKSIWQLSKGNNKLKQTDLESYECFIKQTELLRKSFADKGLFKYSTDILNNFKGTESFNFFSKHKDAFEMRIIDKYLWLFAQEIDDKQFDNSIYIDFINI